MRADPTGVAPPPSVAASGFTASVIQRARDLCDGELPQHVRVIAKQCVLDWIGVAVAGSREPLSRILVELASEDGAAPVATIIGARNRMSVRQAALANGAMGHAIDYDDVNIAGHGHVTAAVLPAAIAMAESQRRSGARLLSAFVAGYEAAVMVGRFVGREHYHLGFHATATVGTYGAACAASLLMGLDDEACARALGIAGTQAAGLKAQFGTMCKPLHAGKAGENGITGAQLASRGFTGRHDILECVQGMAYTQSSGASLKLGLATPRAGAHIADNLFKYSAACYGTHGAIIAAQKLRSEHHLSPDQVRKVRVRVEAGADRMCNIAAPQTGLEAKFSLRFNVALALSGEDTASPQSYTDELTRREDLCALRDRVEVQIMPTSWPLPLTEMDVELADGRVLHATHDTGVPESDLSHQGERLMHKYLMLTVPILGRERAVALAGGIAHIDELDRLDELLQLLR